MSDDLKLFCDVLTDNGVEWEEGDKCINIPFTNDYKIYYSVYYDNKDNTPFRLVVECPWPQTAINADFQETLRAWEEQDWIKMQCSFNGYALWPQDSSFTLDGPSVLIARDEFQQTDLQTAIDLYNTFIHFIQNEIWPKVQRYKRF